MRTILPFCQKYYRILKTKVFVSSYSKTNGFCHPDLGYKNRIFSGFPVFVQQTICILYGQIYFS